jgi:hypothetical protein
MHDRPDQDECPFNLFPISVQKNGVCSKLGGIGS